MSTTTGWFSPRASSIAARTSPGFFTPVMMKMTTEGMIVKLHQPEKDGAEGCQNLGVLPEITHRGFRRGGFAKTGIVKLILGAFILPFAPFKEELLSFQGKENHGDDLRLIEVVKQLLHGGEEAVPGMALGIVLHGEFLLPDIPEPLYFQSGDKGFLLFSSLPLLYHDGIPGIQSGCPPDPSSHTQIRPSPEFIGCKKENRSLLRHHWFPSCAMMLLL